MNATSRFQTFVQERALVGQIAAALLLQGNLGTDTLIHPATLKRISDDVDRERRGREWLRGARHVAEERARIRGLVLGSTKTGPTRRSEEARAEAMALGIEPRLVLRPTGTSCEHWEVSLEIPDLSHLLLHFPRAQEILAESRCVVAGAAGRPLARGRCLHGPQRVALSRWPQSDEVLLQFEQTDPQFEYLLRTECLLRPGPRWLFKIASDGLAYEARGMRVRSGERYVLVSTESPIPSREHARPIEITCEGAYGALLELPDALTLEWEEALRQLGITQAKSIEVWPAGLAAVVWDGEGHGEWLASERPCVAIRSDHPIGALIVSMGSGPEMSLEVGGVPPGEPVFVELPPLPVGLHKVSVAAKSGRGAEAESIGDLDVVMRIREVRPWSPGISTHGPLAVDLEPTAPTLEQLWEGRVEVNVRGPEGRSIRCRVAMFSRVGDAATFLRQLPPLTLPITSDQWRHHFERHFQTMPEAQAVYDEARVCEIEFSAEEIGAFPIHCEREFTPLRWTLRKTRTEYVARLHENVGSAGNLAVERLLFELPTVAERLEVSSEYRVPPSGGLYLARLDDLTAAIIVPLAVRSLNDLRCAPRIEDRERSVDGLLRLIGFARLWGTARLAGGLLSATRQRTVLHALTAHIFRCLGGDTWGDAEMAARGRQDGLADLERSVSRKREEAAIGTALALQADELANASLAARAARLASLVGRFVSLPRSNHRVMMGSVGVAEVSIVQRARVAGPDESTWLIEFALRLASDPAHVEAWAGELLRAGVVRLLEFSTLARAARFLVLATNHWLNSNAAPGELYAGWGWT